MPCRYRRPGREHLENQFSSIMLVFAMNKLINAHHRQGNDHCYHRSKFAQVYTDLLD